MFHAVIPAGGSGTRLWPLSRSHHPKFLHDLTGSKRSLLQDTVDRLEPLADATRTYVVTGTAHATSVARQLPDVPDANLLIEPSPRDSCPAVALAAAVIAERDPSGIMGSFHSDHLIPDGRRFVETVRKAVKLAKDGYLMTIGMTPTAPETGFGYLRCGKKLDGGMVLDEFREKPDRETAQSYVDQGYLWNSGLFVWQVSTFLDELARQQPKLHDIVREIAAAWDTPARGEVIGKLWPELPRISVDHAVMEGAAEAGKVAVVPGDFSWNDLGDWDTLADVLESDVDGNVTIGSGEVLSIDTTNTVVVPRGGRLIATVGVSDLVVVDTEDAVLVCPRSRAQDVKKLVDELKARGDRAHT
ncbi:sugar phosphate nucleotidyltransferase [Phytomonospora sp. NPDC050363]|uniref:mannose-1-phosphate guanylyltransferase n=1 Tax=Phytomonospora sp. NPDC050363 TaxID=3155642 RepID=UPI003405DA71